MGGGLGKYFFGFLFLYLSLNGENLALLSSIWMIVIKEIDFNKFSAKTVGFHCSDLLTD